MQYSKVSDMKKLIVLMLYITFCITPVFAGGDHKDGVKMKDGKVWVKKDGKKTELLQEMTLSDGTKVLPNGTVTMSDGTVKNMKNGDMISMDGKWHTDKMKKDEKKADRDDKKM